MQQGVKYYVKNTLHLIGSDLIRHIHKLVLIFTDNMAWSQELSNIDWLKTAKSGLWAQFSLISFLIKIQRNFGLLDRNALYDMGVYY